MPIPLHLSYRGSPSVNHKLGGPSELLIPVTIQPDVSNPENYQFHLFHLRYIVELFSVPSYGASIKPEEGLRLHIDEVSQEGILSTKSSYLEEESQASSDGNNTSQSEDDGKNTPALKIPLYPEVVEEMNKISAENELVAFRILVDSGYIFYETINDDGLTELAGMDLIRPSLVYENVRGELLSPIRLRNEELTKVFSELEEASTEWLSVPVPQHGDEQFSDSVRNPIVRALQNLQGAREVVHTPNFGQAMIDLRNVRNSISDKKTRDGRQRWYLSDEIEEELMEKIGKREIDTIHDMLNSASHLASKYVHEDRAILAENPPWEETKFAYSIFSHLLWYMSHILSRQNED